MGSHGLSWALMGSHGLSWALIGSDGPMAGAHRGIFLLRGVKDDAPAAVPALGPPVPPRGRCAQCG
eukprot:7271540-Pyramimonas_sp.AAC.1